MEWNHHISALFMTMMMVTIMPSTTKIMMITTPPVPVVLHSKQFAPYKIVEMHHTCTIHAPYNAPYMHHTRVK